MLSRTVLPALLSGSYRGGKARKRVLPATKAKLPLSRLWRGFFSRIGPTDTESEGVGVKPNVDPRNTPLTNPALPCTSHSLAKARPARSLCFAHVPSFPGGPSIASLQPPSLQRE